MNRILSNGRVRITGNWVPHDIRDAVVDYTKAWSDKADIPLKYFISWLVTQPLSHWKILSVDSLMVGKINLSYSMAIVIRTYPPAS